MGNEIDRATVEAFGCSFLLNKKDLEILDLKKVAEENANIANERGKTIVDLKVELTRFADRFSRIHIALMRYESAHDSDPERRKLFQELKEALLIS